MSDKTPQENNVCGLINMLVDSGAVPAYSADDETALRPIWDKSLCTRCALCYLYCPEGAISRQEDGYFDVDTDLCKGCGICHRECWFGAVSMQEVE